MPRGRSIEGVSAGVSPYRPTRKYGGAAQIELGAFWRAQEAAGAGGKAYWHL